MLGEKRNHMSTKQFIKNEGISILITSWELEISAFCQKQIFSYNTDNIELSEQSESVQTKTHGKQNQDK